MKQVLIAALMTLIAMPALAHSVIKESAPADGDVLAETPEIYGAEHLLTRRAVDQATGERLISLVRWWEKNKPSPEEEAP